MEAKKAPQLGTGANQLHADNDGVFKVRMVLLSVTM